MPTTIETNSDGTTPAIGTGLTVALDSVSITVSIQGADVESDVTWGGEPVTWGGEEVEW